MNGFLTADALRYLLQIGSTKIGPATQAEYFYHLNINSNLPMWDEGGRPISLSAIGFIRFQSTR
jgi:hypothetical protein